MKGKWKNRKRFDSREILEIIGISLKNPLNPKIANRIHNVIKSLTPREEKILRMRWGWDYNFEERKTLEEIGDDLDLTRERIRQIEAKALRKLRHPSRAKKIYKGMRRIKPYETPL